MKLYYVCAPIYIIVCASVVPDYESFGPSSVSDDSTQLNQMGWLINGYLRKLWKPGCHSGPVYWGNGLIFTTGSKANVTGDECLQLQRVPTLYTTWFIVFFL